MAANVKHNDKKRNARALRRPGAFLFVTLGKKTWQIHPTGRTISTDEALKLISDLRMKCGDEALFDGCDGQTWRV